MVKKYTTTIIIEFNDEKIEELKERCECVDENDVNNACYDYAQEIALDVKDYCCETGCRTYFADSILYVDEI